ncbi:hypothetical protein RB598_007410 [Gaeumannomyces tritici]
MQLIQSLLLGLCLTGSGAVAAELPGPHMSPLLRRGQDGAPETAPKNDTIAPKRFIVEFDQDKAGGDARQAADALKSSLPKGCRVLRVYSSEVFKGASVEVEGSNVDTLNALDAVSRAWNARYLTLPEESLVPQQKFASYSEAATAGQLKNYSIHHMTGVDKLHAAGIKGKGVKIAFVDTGVDYNHPALGSGFGPGHKVVGGYDLVGNGDYPRGPKQPDDDPMDQAGHGTHVAGIIAGQDKTFVGVAPESSLLAYKVFTANGGVDEDTLIDAFLMAYEAGADIITSSIGGVNGWTDSAWASVSSRLVDQGVVVTISAGNDGQAGAFSASSGSSGENVLAIASITADTIASPMFNMTFTLDGQSNSTMVAYRSEQNWYPSKIQGWPITPLSLNTSVQADACQPLPNTTKSLANQVVLVRRGGCNFDVKRVNLERLNATAIVFYNDDMPLAIPQRAPFVIPLSNMTMITKEAGEAIIATVKAGGSVTADFNLNPNDHHYTGASFFWGGKADSFTSLGATNDMFIKPDVAAPGGQILSSFPGGGYAVQSGTSMSCPYVAGIAALYIGAHGGSADRKARGGAFAKQVAARILSSGDAVAWYVDDGNEKDFHARASVAQVGTGMVNATKVLGYSTQLSFARFALNDTAHFNRDHSVDITNSGPAPVTYSFELEEAGAINAVQIDDGEHWGAPRMSWFEELIQQPQQVRPGVEMPAPLTLQPGETRTARFAFSPPTGGDPASLPLYSGKVLVKGDNGETLSVPYMGMAADLVKELPGVFDVKPAYERFTSGVEGVPVEQKASWTFNTSLAAQDFPEIYVRLVWATRELRIDVFEEGWTEDRWAYPPAVGKDGFVGAVATYARPLLRAKFDPERMNASETISTPLRSLPRDVSGRPGTTFWWLGQMANGSHINPGRYHLRVAALKPWSDPRNSTSWDTWTWVPKIEVLPLGA